MIEEALVTHLRNDVDISNKVKVGSIWHIYPLKLPSGINLDSKGYAIAYEEIDQRAKYPIMRESLFQFKAFGNTFEKARDLANDIDESLNDLSEIKLGDTFNVTYIKFVTRRVMFDDTAQLWYYVIEMSLKY